MLIGDHKNKLEISIKKYIRYFPFVPEWYATVFICVLREEREAKEGDVEGKMDCTFGNIIRQNGSKMIITP